MSDLSLFRLIDGKANELQPSTSPLEKHLQTLLEANLEAMFGVRFLATEFQTSNGGRMDTIGLDENGYPVIVEYKRTKSENVINQGLFYLDWLMDHRADFSMLVLNALGSEMVETIDWSAPRLICVAEDFTKYDEHAVRQMNHNIELVRYRRYGDELVLLELVNAVVAKSTPTSNQGSSVGKQKAPQYKTVDEYIAQADESVRELYETLRLYLLGLGDDVLEKHTKLYVAFRRLKNFACVEVHPQSKTLLVYVKVDPTSVNLVEGLTRDVREIGHFGTGDLEIRISSHQDLESAFPLLEKSYDIS